VVPAGLFASTARLAALTTGRAKAALRRIGEVLRGPFFCTAAQSGS